MPTPDEVLERWTGMIDNDFAKTFRQTFELPEDDDYIYKAESFGMTLSQIQERVETGMKWRYWVHDQAFDVSDSDVTAYTSIFASTTDTSKALSSFSANAKKSSPRIAVAAYLASRRHVPPQFKTPKLKKPHTNPYFDVWVWTCLATRFMGPLGDASYAHPSLSKQTHPMLPVLYHHFGCACPSYEALAVLQQLVESKNDGNSAGASSAGIIEMASGSGYWTYLLRRLGVSVVAVDSQEAQWRYMWIEDTVRADGVEYLRRAKGAPDRVLLMVYMVTQGEFTKRVLRAYKGRCIVVAGSQNANRYTTFADVTVDEYFAREMPTFELAARLILPSFAGKDEAMYVYIRKEGEK